MGKNQQMGNDKQLRAAIEHATTWVEKIDRSVIGCLVARTEALATAHAYFLSEFRNDKKQERLNSLLRTEFSLASSWNSAWISKDNTFNIIEAEDTVKAELWFWWRRIMRPAWADYTHEDTHDKIEERILLLELASSRPASHPYIEAGISDTINIRAFIENDVDVDLALSLLANDNG